MASESPVSCNGKSSMRSKSNPGSKALESELDRLTDAVSDPTMFATQLNSEGIVPYAAVTPTHVNGVTNYFKSSIIFKAVHSYLETNNNATDFEKVLRVLDESGAVTPGSADLLRQAYNKIVGIPSGETPTSKPHTECNSLPRSIQSYAAALKSKYKRVTIPGKWRPSSIKEYIKLSMVEKQRPRSRPNAINLTICKLRNGIDDIVRDREQIKIEDALKPQGQKVDQVRCVLVEGPPGVGKSTFAWELCQRWDSIPDLKKFSLVVLLRFRDKRVQVAKDIPDLFYHDDASIQQAVAKEVCIRSGEGLLLILDGFDEFPAHLRKCSLLLDIIKGSRLPGCTVIVTSRPSATADLIDVCRVDTRIEVLGFLNKEIEEYASTAFDSDELLREFQQYRRLNPSIESILYIPLVTDIVADAFLTDKPLSYTLTQLCERISVEIVKKTLRIESAKLNNLLKVCPHFGKVAKMAFEGVIKNELIFPDVPTECERFGFLNASSERYLTNAELSCHFINISFQKLFAAFHISQLEENEQKEIFKNNFTDDFSLVWRFAAGLNCFEVIGWKIVKEKCSLPQLVSFLYEAQDANAGHSILGKRDEVFEASSLLDCHAVGWCIGASECRLKLNFTRMESQVCEVFVTGVKSRMSKQIPCGCISGLDLSHTPIKEEDVTHLMELPPIIWHDTVSEFKVSHCGLDANAGKMLARLILHMDSDIGYFSFCGNNDNCCGELLSPRVSKRINAFKFV